MESQKALVTVAAVACAFSGASLINELIYPPSVEAGPGLECSELCSDGGEGICTPCDPNDPNYYCINSGGCESEFNSCIDTCCGLQAATNFSCTGPWDFNSQVFDDCISEALTFCCC